VEQAVDVMMTSEVGDDRAGRRHEQDHSGTVARDHARRPPRSRLVVVDAASVRGVAIDQFVYSVHCSVVC